MLNSPFDLHRTARKYLPGGVSASARANVAIGHPFYVTRGSGSKIYDLEGREYIDMCMSHGAAFLGHNNPKIKAAVSKALDVGIICSYETEYHIKLAKKLTDLVPCAEMVRFAGSGTETIMHALRLCRSATGREKIIKFEGHFHGYSDDIYFSSAPPLERAGDPLEPTPFPQSSGIPNENANRLVIVPFNDQAALQSAFVHHGDQVAALILEPVNYDAGCIEPQPGFLELCRQLCDRYGVLLFFDEVLTAFRFSAGCAQQYFGVVPDIAVLGKAFGAGMPISAIVGKRNVMRHLRPEGESEHSGTYLAHLTAVMAALAALEEYSQPGFYQHLEQLGKFFYPGFQDIIDRSGVPARLQYVGPRFGLYFGLTEEVKDYRQSALQNRQMFLKFIAGCIECGVYFHVSPHHGFSVAHTESDIVDCLEVIEEVFLAIKKDFS